MGGTSARANSGSAQWTWCVRLCDEEREVLGCGVLLAPTTVVTCAHVLAPNGATTPAPRVWAHPVGVPGGVVTQARPIEGCWLPALPHNRGDLALLTLSDPQPADCVARLCADGLTPGQRLRTVGFPKHLDDGVVFEATLGTAGNQQSEWVPMVPTRPSHTVRPGFSGAGVVADDSRRVVGMVVGRYDDPDSSHTADPIPVEQRLSFSYMIPAAVIERWLAECGRQPDGSRRAPPAAEGGRLADAHLRVHERFADLTDQIAEIERLERTVRRLLQSVGPGRRVAQRSTRLRAALTPLRAMAASAPDAVAEDLDRFQSQLTRVRERTEHSRSVAEAALAERNALRGRLDAFQARLAARGLAEDRLAARRYRAAHALLWQAPCDVPAAARAVRAFVHTVEEAVRGGDRPAGPEPRRNEARQ